MILSCSKISKSFLDKQILNNITFCVEDNEKVAIVGDNGCGKSTLLKIIMNKLSCDSGQIAISNTTSIGYLAQHQDTNSDNTLYEEILSAKEHILKLEQEMKEVNTLMETSTGEELEQLVNKYASLNSRYEYENGYAYKSEVLGILNGLGFTKGDYDKKLSQFSGGQKTRITLGKILLTAPDLLILDEPTNHLDIESISWLENYLLNYKGAVILVSHDRYFLDKLVTKVIHIEQSKATTYNGNYTDFQAKYAMKKEIELKHYENQQAQIKHQQEVIDKLRSFNREKSIKRAESRQKALDKMDVLDKPVNIDHKMKLNFNPKIESGNDVLSVQGLSKSFKNNFLFSNLDFEIKKGEKVALIGANGTGKTTILKIINNILPADAGIIKLGTNVILCYYDQEMAVLDNKNTLFEEISNMRPELTNTEIRNILAAFLFVEDDVFKQISSLSGGEKGRLSLAKLMLSNANFLILDEPTNHLDILSKDILENAINSYTGTVLYVSHDRYFINKTATRILSLTNNTLYNYIGNYDYYLEKKTIVENPIYIANTDDNSNSKNFNHSAKTDNSTTVSPSNSSDSKLSWQQEKEARAKERKRKKDLNKLENQINEIENEITKIEEEIADPKIASDISKLLPLSSRKEELDNKLLELMELWEEIY